MKNLLFVGALFCAAFFAVSAYAQEAPEASSTSQQKVSNIYKLRHTDALEMSILQEPEMSRLQTRVSADGFVSFPMIGKVHVAGLTLAEAEDLITKLYQKDYYVEPIVTLNIVAYAKQSCFVVGFVNSPQECIFPLEEEDTMTIAKVIARCNGFSPRGERTNVIVKRRVDDKLKTFVINVKKILSEDIPDFPIYNGDVIEVREAIF